MATKTWVVAREDGQYSDYRMSIVAVHDCKEAAQADAAKRQRPIDEANEQYKKYRKTVAIRMKINVNKNGWEKNFEIALRSPDVVEERAALGVATEAWLSVDGVVDKTLFTVHGPFEMVPWKVMEDK